MRSATIGTPTWMAPELHAGAPAGMASDLYSLGCLLWATLTGRAPYAGASEDRVVAAHREQPVPQLLGDSPMAREVNRILRTAMAKDPAARYRTAAELRDDLRRAATLADAARSGPTATTSSRRFVPVAASARRGRGRVDRSRDLGRRWRGRSGSHGRDLGR